jgi:hypothetical protein
MLNPIKSNSTVTIVDSIMGSGKTSWAIQLMNETPEVQKFIYVTPYLSEIERIKLSVTNREFVTPDSKQGKGKKYEHFKRLIGEGKDILTTHSLFSYADEELLELLEWNNYILIMDEVFQVIEQIPLKQDDLKILVNSQVVTVQEEGKIDWVDEKMNSTRYDDIKKMAKCGSLYLINNAAFIWLFPAEIFKSFEKIYILTYLFEGQIQRYYYDFYNIQYEYRAVINEEGRYGLVDYWKYKEDRSKFKLLINICDNEKLNSIGEKETSLSKSWFSQKYNAPKVKQLKNNLYNYFQHITKAKSEEIMWMTFKDYKEKLKGKGYSKVEKEDKPGCYTSFNLRATNLYRHKTVLAFCLNRYMNPIESHFFKQHNIVVNEDLLALSDLLQWIYRSAIRDGKPIQIYIPSKRMRNLLKQWLNNEI